jgi:hypothetical protein
MKNQRIFAILIFWMKREYLGFMTFKSPVFFRKLSFGVLILLFAGLSSSMQAQERFQNLYSPQTIQKYKIKTMSIELFATLGGGDSIQVAGQEADNKERFFFDEQGRPSLFEETNASFRRSGTAGPHLLSQYEYSEDGHICHRHDSTVFGSSNEWHFISDSLGKLIKVEMILPGQENVFMEKNYLYDPKGRLQKAKSNLKHTAEGTPDQCVWIFYVHDNQSFNATSLSPMDMARCQCSLEYLDDEARAVRRVMYDSTGTIAQTLLINYDRTGKLIRLEMMDAAGVALKAWADVIYGRGAIVSVDVNGNLFDSELLLVNLGTMAQEMVIAQWADWRLLKELRLKVAGREVSRHRLSYTM